MSNLPRAIVLIAFLAILVPSARACTCVSSPEPFYCQADFVALVQITDKQANSNGDSIRYRFRVVDLLVDRHKLSSSRGFPHHLHTGGSSAMCGVDLARHGRYLVAASLFKSAGGGEDVGGRPGRRLQLSLCRSFVQKYGERERVEPSEWQAMKDACNVSKPLQV